MGGFLRMHVLISTKTMINYLLVVSRQGKLRLSKWFTTLPPSAKAKIVREVSQLVLGRKPKTCNFIEWKGSKIVYKRYASLFFICEVEDGDNELITLEVIHRYVEALDKYFERLQVCELDVIFNFQKVYALLDELVIAGELVEPSAARILKATMAMDAWVEREIFEEAILSGI